MGDMDGKGLGQMKKVRMRVVGAKPSVLRKVCYAALPACAHVFMFLKAYTSKFDTLLIEIFRPLQEDYRDRPHEQSRVL
jgi:hypothetical protein